MIKEIGNYKVDTEKLFYGAPDNETFRVVEVNDRFLVSNMARCYDMKRDTFIKDYTPKVSPYSVWYLCSFTNNKDKRNSNAYPIHRIVAEAFCDKPTTDERLVVDHIDGDKHNNLASNLRWITYKENSNAQDVQKRKAETLHKTIEHKNEVNELKEQIVQSNRMIQELQKEVKKIQAENKELRKTVMQTIFKKAIDS